MITSSGPGGEVSPEVVMFPEQAVPIAQHSRAIIHQIDEGLVFEHWRQEPQPDGVIELHQTDELVAAAGSRTTMRLHRPGEDGAISLTRETVYGDSARLDTIDIFPGAWLFERSAEVLR